MKSHIRIIAPDKIALYTSVREVILPTTTGEIGILEGHAPLITALQIGVLRYKIDQGWIPLVIKGGVAKIKGDEVLVLASGIEEILKENYEKAQDLFAQANDTFSAAQTLKEKLEASENLKLAVARLQAYQFLN
jgi:F-type H+-transporting ATPase subunit epsilon